MQLGEVRTVEKFLWWPKSINGHWKWLCKAKWREVVVEEIDYLAMDHGCSEILKFAYKPTNWIKS